jgi:cleavage stimulation factor subunit 3
MNNCRGELTWNTYPVRKTHHGRGNYHKVMQQAFEFALSACGHDKDSGPIWSDFLEFVKGWPRNNPDEIKMQTEKLRAIYHRALVIPLENMEQLWREYDAYEQSLNRTSVRTPSANQIMLSI